MQCHIQNEDLIEHNFFSILVSCIVVNILHRLRSRLISRLLLMSSLFSFCIQQFEEFGWTV